MKNSVKELSLPNGLTVSFIDHSRQYFGDFYQVRLEIICRVPVCEKYVTEPEELVRARSILGDAVTYRRMEEQMGVPSSKVEMVLQQLVGNYLDHSHVYFKSDTFPRKFISRELSRLSSLSRRPFTHQLCES